MMRLIIIIVFFFGPLSSFSENYVVTGKIIDEKTKEPLAFVSIIINGSQQGTASDIDGKFKISSDKPITNLLISYVGYQTLNYTVNSASNILVKLKRKDFELSEVKVFVKENPAHRIIKQASLNRNKNNPDKIKSYTCNTYCKTVYDFVPNISDSIVSSVDTSDFFSSHFFGKSHMLIMESVTERSYISPGNLNEKIIATKMSGFKNPSFSTSATDLQPFSFYDDYFNMLNKDYLNPITSGSTSKYYFNLEDTLYQNNDSVFVISFRPLKGKNFDGLQGVLYINTNGYAIQNVLASPYEKGLILLKIQQQYKLVNNQQWFPDQLNYELYMKNYPSNVLGMKVNGKSFITNVSFSTDLKKRDFDFKTVTMNSDAANRDSIYWGVNRIDSLTVKEKTTYQLIDSIGKAEHLDRKLKILESIFSLQYPISIININLDKIVRMNNYERLRIGIGLHTNDLLSKRFSVGGYFGYGFNDFTYKYGYDAALFFRKSSKEYFIKYSYLNDISEPGQNDFFYQKNNLKRILLTSRMDAIEQHEVSLHFRALKYLTSNLSYIQSQRLPKYEYSFFQDVNSISLPSGFRMTEIAIKARYAYKEKLIQSFGQLLSDGTKYPTLYFSYNKGFKTPNLGYYDYSKYTIGIEKEFLIKNIGKTNVFIEAGKVEGMVPYSFLFNGKGSYTNDRYLYVEKTFQTMGLYEFILDKYANIFIAHNFGSLLFKREKFKPQFTLLNSVGYGNLSNGLKHRDIKFKTMEKGYFESGLVIDNIFKFNYLNLCYIGLGGGAFMKYGAYADSKLGSNMAYKLSFKISF